MLSYPLLWRAKHRHEAERSRRVWRRPRWAGHGAAACPLPSPGGTGTSRTGGRLRLQPARCRVVCSILALLGIFFWPVAWVLPLARLQAGGPSSVPGGTEAVSWPRSSRGHYILPAKNPSAVRRHYFSPCASNCGFLKHVTKMPLTHCVAAVGVLLRWLRWDVSLPPPGKAAAGLTSPGSERRSVGSAHPLQTLKGTTKILQRKEFLVPLFCLNKYPLANVIKVRNEHKTLSPMVNSKLSHVAGYQVPAWRGTMLWSIIPPRLSGGGERSKPALGKHPTAVPPPREVPSAAAERLQRRRNRCRWGPEPCKAPEPRLRPVITIRKMTFRLRDRRRFLPLG